MIVLSRPVQEAHHSSQEAVGEPTPPSLFLPYHLLCQPTSIYEVFLWESGPGHSPGMSPLQPGRCGQHPHRGVGHAQRHSWLPFQPRAQQHNKMVCKLERPASGREGAQSRKEVAKEPDPRFPSQKRAISPQKKPPGAVSTQPDPLGTCLKGKNQLHT